jgi:hypothetical protein
LLVNPANRINAGFFPGHLCFLVKTIPQKRHCFSWFAFVQIALGLCAPVRFVSLRIANNVVKTVKNKEHDQSPSKPEKTTIANPPMVTIANDKNAGPIPRAKPNAPMAKRTTPPVQTNPIKILFSMINPKK